MQSISNALHTSESKVSHILDKDGLLENIPEKQKSSMLWKLISND